MNVARCLIASGPMARRMTLKEGKEFKKRWKLVRRAERAELRSTPMSVKLEQLAALMASARALGWDTTDPREVRAVRARWARLARKLSQTIVRASKGGAISRTGLKKRA